MLQTISPPNLTENSKLCSYCWSCCGKNAPSLEDRKPFVARCLGACVAPLLCLGIWPSLPLLLRILCDCPQVPFACLSFLIRVHTYMPVYVYSLLCEWHPWAFLQGVSVSAAPRSLYLTQPLSCFQCPFFHPPACPIQSSHTHFGMCTCVHVHACACTHTHTHTHTHIRILKRNLQTCGTIGLLIQYNGLW